MSHLFKSICITVLFFLGLSVVGQEELSLTFSPKGGFYETTQKITLQSDSGAVIYYTLDGSVPSKASFKYKEPIAVKGSVPVRARAYRNTQKSTVITETYFTSREFTLPVISIVTDPRNFFDYQTGIYVKGCCADTIEPYFGANFMRSWEKPINIEMYEPNGDQCFNQKAGARIHGGYSRMLPQKSLAIIARSKYGKNRFNYPIFTDRPHKKYKSFLLRNSGGDFKRTHLRDAFMTQLAKPTGLAIQAYEPAIVFINGEYWGIQNIREKINEHYLKQNFNVDPDNVDLVRHQYTAQHGSSKNYRALLAYLRRINIHDEEPVDKLKKWMNVTDFINYNIAEVFSDNRDAGGNIRYFRERSDSAKWRWILFDMDMGLNNNHKKGYTNNTLKEFTEVSGEIWPNPPWSTFIIRRLLENRELRNQYINTFADQLNTIYSPTVAMALLDSLSKRIEPEIEKHQQRWESSLKNWKIHMNSLRTFIKKRPYEVRKHILEKFDLKDTAKIIVHHPGIDKGIVRVNSVLIDKDFEGIYFEGVPVEVTIYPKHDFVFKGWKGGKESERKIIVNPHGEIHLEAIFEERPRSIFKDSIIINEVNFWQSNESKSGDWIELYNRSEKALNLKGWGISNKDYVAVRKVEDDLVINPGGFALFVEGEGEKLGIVVKDSVAISEGVKMNMSENESVRIYDEEGFVVDSLSLFSSVKDSIFSISRVHIDSLEIKHFQYEKPTPAEHNIAYRLYLKNRAEKAYWKRMFFYGGGGFFFILAVGWGLYRYYKKRKVE